MVQARSFSFTCYYSVAKWLMISSGVEFVSLVSTDVLFSSLSLISPISLGVCEIPQNVR